MFRRPRLHLLSLQASVSGGQMNPSVADRTPSLALAAEDHPLASVVIVCYNQAHYLSEAIESALAQTYCPLEVLVIDDGSTDDTASVAHSYSSVRYVRQNNRGLAAARRSEE